MKKNIIISIIVVLALLVAGYFFIEKQNAPVEEGYQGKININEVCNGALAYMTFPDSTSAEVFLEECRLGEHPEVIEKFKADMSLGAGAEI